MKIIKGAPIRSVILTPEKVKEIAQQIYDDYERDLKQKREKEYFFQLLKFILRSEDGTQYEASDMSVFQEDGVLKTRKIVFVEMRYFTSKDDKEITVGLRHAVNPYYSNEIKVSGLDEKWVNGTFTALQDTLKNCEKQKTFFADHTKQFRLLFLVCFVFSVYIISGLLFDLVAKFIIFSNPENFRLIRSISVMGVSIWSFTLLIDPVFALVDKIEALYPNVELLVGPEHLQREARKRRRLLSLLAIVIIPTLISIVVALVF